MSLLDPSLAIARLDAANAAGVLGALASLLERAGKVKASFAGAAVAREKKSPTGLPFTPWAVALPHADPEHATSPAIAIASLAAPVSFRQMGSPGVTLAVSLVVMPAFTAKEQAAGALAQLMGLLQAAALREELVRASTPEEMVEAFGKLWDGS